MPPAACSGVLPSGDDSPIGDVRLSPCLIENHLLLTQVIVLKNNPWLFTRLEVCNLTYTPLSPSKPCFFFLQPDKLLSLPWNRKQPTPGACRHLPVAARHKIARTLFLPCCCRVSAQQKYLLTHRTTVCKDSWVLIFISIHRPGLPLIRSGNRIVSYRYDENNASAPRSTEAVTFFSL